MRYIVLSELETSDAEQLIRALENNWRFRHSEQLRADDVETIWVQTGGNPRLIEEAVCELQMRRVRFNRDLSTPYP